MSLLMITVNGAPQQTSARNHAELCEALGDGEAKIATALNGDFIPAPLRAKTELSDKDSVEIVAPRQGG
jgi:sulfur carrier protein